MSTKSNYNLFTQSYPFSQEGALYLVQNIIFIIRMEPECALQMINHEFGNKNALAM